MRRVCKRPRTSRLRSVRSWHQEFASCRAEDGAAPVAPWKHRYSRPVGCLFSLHTISALITQMAKRKTFRRHRPPRASRGGQREAHGLRPALSRTASACTQFEPTGRCHQHGVRVIACKLGTGHHHSPIAVCLNATIATPLGSAPAKFSLMTAGYVPGAECDPRFQAAQIVIRGARSPSAARARLLWGCNNS